MSVHPAVLIGGLSGITAALGLIASLARAVYKNATNATINTQKLSTAVTDIEELQDIVARHDTQLAVLNERTEDDQPQNLKRESHGQGD